MAKTPATKSDPNPTPATPASDPDFGTMNRANAPQTRDEIAQTRKVRAIKPCYYNDERKRIGDVFRIRPPYRLGGVEHDEFSSHAMEDVDEDTPERTTTAKEQLRKEHDEIIKSRHPPGVLPQDRNVLGDD
jgi:hypothetical protein